MKPEKDGEYYNRDAIKQHYQNQPLQNIIRIFSDYKGCHKAGKYDDKGLYRYRKNKRRLLDFQDQKDFNLISDKSERIILSTLNYFDAELFNEWQPKDDESPGGFSDTIYMMLSVDIDLADDYDIQDQNALDALKTAGKFLYEILADVTNDNILVLFSGNGIYLHLHPALAYLPEDYQSDEREQLYDLLTKAFNLYLQDLESELLQAHPAIQEYIKIDAINNRKRYFKTILSLHKSLPYVVYPINPDSFDIPLKTLPLTAEDLQDVQEQIQSFMDKELTHEPLARLKKALVQYEDDIKVRKREYQELDIQIPDKAIPLETILSEPVTAAMFHPDGWLKGNTRRVAYMASTLHLCGWDNTSIPEYIERIANNWHVGALSHVIDSWINMHPPNNDTIYKKGSNYPMMNFGDCIQHLPDKPEYHSPLKEIFRIAGINQNADPEPIIEPDVQIDLSYPTEHLIGYKNLKTAIDLFGEHYSPIFKALWYQLLGFRIGSAYIHAGRIKTDGRISVLYPIKAGHGKGELKRIIKSYVSYFDGIYGEPTSLHAEQLVGKTSKKSKVEEYIQRPGYLADDWLVIDEAYNLLSSNELHYSEARKYIRTALDRYPGNTITKRTTEYGRDAPLEYDPSCPISLFLQPKIFENDILVLEGDIRRVICPYVQMAGIDKSDAYKQNIFDESDNTEYLNKFCSQIENLNDFNEFTMTTDAKVKFLELFNDLNDYGLQYNEKIRNFTDINDFTAQIQFLKFAAVQAFQHGRNKIQTEDVQLAYIDFFEIMNHMFQYVNAKIPGYLNYGEGWEGAESKDQELITWMYQYGAIDEANAMTNDLYLDQVMDIYEVKERQANTIKKNQQDKGWIESKRIKSGSIIWLKFIPDSLKCSDCNLQSGYAEDVSGEYSIKYYLLLNNYYNILNKVQLDCNDSGSNPIANCKDCKTPDEFSTTTDSDDSTPAMLHVQHEPGTSNQILKYSYSELKMNQESGIRAAEFTTGLYKVAGCKAWEDAEDIQLNLSNKGWIHHDTENQLIKPSEKLIERFSN